MTSFFRYTISAAVLLALTIVLACSGGSDEEDAPTGDAFASNTPVPTGSESEEEPTPGLVPATDCASLPAPTQPLRTPPEVQVKTYPQKPDMTIDADKKYLAHLYTEKGHIIINLRPDLAPEHVNSFVFLANDKYYDGLVFHRVVPGFVAQTGDPTGTGSGGPGYNVPLEASDTPFNRGVLGMARTSDPNSAGSQWFITLDTASHLNGSYTVFGEVVSGMEFVDCIAQGDKVVELSITEL
jgi:cyclophilin family peptidyl-prolyl cis-trans isomerase